MANSGVPVNLDRAGRKEHIEYHKSIEVNAKMALDVIDEVKDAGDYATAEGDRAKEFSDNIEAVMKDGPTQTVNGRTGQVAGLAEQSDLEATNAQLAETENGMDDFSAALNHTEYNGAVVSFGMDDGHNMDYDRLMPIFRSEGVPANSAIVTSLIGESGYMTLERLNYLKSLGWGIVSHTHTHTRWTSLNDEQVEFELSESKRILKENGFDHEIVVYPFGVPPDQSRVFNIARRYFKMGVNIIYANISNETPFIDNYNLRRHPGLSQPESAGATLEECKASVDEAIEKGTYLIFEDHSYYSNWTEGKLNDLKLLIQYIKSKGIPIVNYSQGYAMKCNVVDIGSYGKGFKLYKNGLTSSMGYENYDVNSATPITSYPFGVSNTFFANAQIDGKGFPTNRGGTLTTLRVANSIYYPSEDLSGFQVFRPYNLKELYMREWRSSNDWGVFVKIGYDPVETEMNKYNATTDISAFPNDQITSFFVNAAGGSGFPENQAGVCTVYKVGNQNGYHRQEFRPYRKNELWCRQVAISGSGWESWVMI